MASTFHDYFGAKGIATSPKLPRLEPADCLAALAEGFEDALEMPTYPAFVGLLYALAGVTIVSVASFADALQLAFPLASGFALIGPFVAVGLFEMSRRRELGLAASWRDGFAVLRSPALPSILTLGLFLFAIFSAWIAAAQILYVRLYGPEPPAAATAFLRDALTSERGFLLAVLGGAVGFCFAAAALSISIISFPLMLDRDVGWILLRDRYDDGGFSGGSMERPALQKLLEDVRCGRIDVVVVYKVDRLTRSLTDFAKLVELFDARGVSFVSVTQAFNTTTSMGRLTLNVLLSFAQFEREVTGERIRDKIAASKKKGLWMGGVVPLGYRVEDRALHVVEDHAIFVRDLFRRYLEIGAVVPLKAALDCEDVRLPLRTDGTGKPSGGGLISRGHLYKILSNPIYVGRLSHKGQAYDGQHAAIVDRGTWDRVQVQLATHAQVRRSPVQASEALLVGKLYDDRGSRMSPSEASRGGRRWRYYVSQAILQGRKQEAGSIARVAAPEVERKVLETVRASLGDLECADADIWAWVERVTIGRGGLAIQLNDQAPQDLGARTITNCWAPASTRRRREIVQGNGSPQADLRPMRVEARRVFLSSYCKARAWLDRLESEPQCSVASIAQRERRTERSIRQTLSLGFLDPALVAAAIDGRLPRGFGLQRLMDLPPEWSQQWTALGLAAPDRR